MKQADEWVQIAISIKAYRFNEVTASIHYAYLIPPPSQAAIPIPFSQMI